MRKRSIKIPGAVIFGVVIGVIALLMLLTTTGLVRIPFVDTVIRVVFVPVQKFAASVVQNTQNYFEDIAFERDLKVEYQNLQDQYKQSLLDLNEMEELRKENERLRKLLGRSTLEGEREYILADVVAMDPSNWFSSFTIDVGKRQGVSKNDAVVTETALVGHVVEVYDDYATVMAIIDGRSAVHGLIERTRDNGIVRGNLAIDQQDELCRMVYLPSSAELQFGDKVLSSGLDGIYPKGLLIGTVRDLSSTAGSEPYVVIDPAADFRRLEEVLVIRGEVKAWTQEEQ